MESQNNVIFFWEISTISHKSYSSNWGFCAIKKGLCGHICAIFLYYQVLIQKVEKYPLGSQRSVCTNLLNESNIAPIGEFRNCFPEKLYCFYLQFHRSYPKSTNVAQWKIETLSVATDFLLFDIFRKNSQHVGVILTLKIFKDVFNPVKKMVTQRTKPHPNKHRGLVIHWIPRSGLWIWLKYSKHAINTS